MNTKADKEALFDAGDEFGDEIYQQAKKDLSLSRGVNMVLLLIALLLALSLAMAIPLKTVEPFVITVDSHTGRVEIAEVLKEKTIPASESLNKYWINQYLICREGYDFQDLEECYRKVVLMSSTRQAGQFAGEFDPASNENSPLNLYGEKTRVKLKVPSISFLDEDTAVARIQKTLEGVQQSNKPIHEVVTLSFTYKPESVNERSRRDNPLGFKVTDYRNDPEVIN